jgi:multidrug resistance efflux pump
VARERLIDLRDVGEFRQTLETRPPAIAHGTAFLLIGLLIGAAIWATLTKANVVVRGNARVRPADAPLRGLDELSSDTVYAEIAGRIVELPVKEGQTVAKGDVLLRLDTARVENEITRTRSELAAAEAELAAIDKTVGLQKQDAGAETAEQRVASVELEAASRELSQARQLVAQHAGPRSDVNTAAAKVERARAQLNAAGRDHEVKLADLARQRAAKQSDLVGTQKRLANLELDRDHCTLVANRAGIVTLGGLERGDMIAVGKLPLAIIEQGRLRVDAAISTADVAPLKVGMRVRVKLAALDYQRYGTAGGTLTHVGADVAMTADGRPYYLVSVALDSDELGRGDLRGQLKPGMTGELEVITRREPLLKLLVNTIRGSIAL